MVAETKKKKSHAHAHTCTYAITLLPFTFGGTFFFLSACFLSGPRPRWAGFNNCVLGGSGGGGAWLRSRHRQGGGELGRDSSAPRLRPSALGRHADRHCFERGRPWPRAGGRITHTRRDTGYPAVVAWRRLVVDRYSTGSGLLVSSLSDHYCSDVDLDCHGHPRSSCCIASRGTAAPCSPLPAVVVRLRFFFATHSTCCREATWGLHSRRKRGRGGHVTCLAASRSTSVRICRGR